MLSQFGAVRSVAAQAYEHFVREGIDSPSPLLNVKYQLLLGDHLFVNAHHGRQGTDDLAEVVREERRALALPLNEYASRYIDRNEAMARAYLSTAFTMSQIANEFGVSTRTVSRALERFEAATSGTLEHVSKRQT